MITLKNIGNKEVREIVKSGKFNTCFKHEYEVGKFDWGIVLEDGTIQVWKGNGKPEVVSSYDIDLVEEWAYDENGYLMSLN